MWIDLHFIYDSWYWTSFHVSVGYLYIFIGKNVQSSLCPFLIGFFFFGVELYSSLYLFILTFYYRYHLQICFPFHWVSFMFSQWFPLLCKRFLLWGHLGSSVGWASKFGSDQDLMVRGFVPHMGLWADGSESGACFGFGVSLSLSLPLPCSCSVSLKNK